MRPAFSNITPLWLCTTLLLLSLVLVLSLPRSVSTIEAQLAAAIQDSARAPDTPRAVARYALASLTSAWESAPSETPAQTYAILLDGWQWLAGQSDFARRWLSALASSVALVAFWRLFNSRIAAPLLLISAYVFLDFATSFDGWMMSLALTLLAVALSQRWCARSTIRDALIYLIVGLGAVVIFWPAILVLVVHATWMRRHSTFPRHAVLVFGGLLAGSIVWLGVLAFTGSLLPLQDLSHARLQSVALLVIFLIAQYLLHQRNWQRYLQPTLLSVMMLVQISFSGWLFSNQPDWHSVTETIAANRQPLEPLFLLTAPDHPASYYAQQTPFDEGLALRLGWQENPMASLPTTLNAARGQETLWLVGEAENLATWMALHRLYEGRLVGYRAAVTDARFYQFAHPSGTQLQFRYGSDLLYDGSFGVLTQRITPDDNQVCRVVNWLNVAPEVDYQIRLALIAQPFVVIEQETLISLASEQQLCWQIPDDLVAGTYGLGISVAQSGRPLALTESDLEWGRWLLQETITLERD